MCGIVIFEEKKKENMFLLFHLHTRSTFQNKNRIIFISLSLAFECRAREQKKKELKKYIMIIIIIITNNK